MLTSTGITISGMQNSSRSFFGVLAAILVLGGVALIFRAKTVPVDTPPPEAFVPVRKTGAEDPQLSLRAAGVFYADETGRITELYGKGATASTPIASITKLMLAIMANEIYAEIDVFTVDRAALSGKGPSGFFKIGEKFTLTELVHAMLIESNNDAARLLAARVGEFEMVARMNEKATELGMNDTVFRSPTGLDLDTPREASNRSTPRDLATLLFYIQAERPELFEIARKQEYQIVDATGAPHHLAVATNKLLSDSSLGIIGGKTGDTPLAKKNLALLLRAPNGRGSIVTVVLGSDDHFADSRKLMEWTNSSFRWE